MTEYLPQTTVLAAQTRSAQQATALGCDGILTKLWWPVIPLTNPDGGGNLAYIQITETDPCFGVAIQASCAITKSHPGAVATTGLTAQEQAALVTSASVSPTFVQTSAQIWHKGTTISLTIAPFTDPRNETITYTATGLPAAGWLTFSPQTINFSGTVPAGESTELLTLHVTGTDQSGFSVTQGVGVSVTP